MGINDTGMSTIALMMMVIWLCMLLFRQRVGGAPSSAPTRGTFAFGSRLPIAQKSLLKRPKKSGNVNLHLSMQTRQENAGRSSTLFRKRSRSSSRNSDEETSKTKLSHGTLTEKTAVSPSSNLPIPTSVSHLLKNSRVSVLHQKREVPEEHELVAGESVSYRV